MDKDQKKIVIGEQGNAEACGPSPGPGCSAEANSKLCPAHDFNIDDWCMVLTAVLWVAQHQKQISEEWTPAEAEHCMRCCEKMREVMMSDPPNGRIQSANEELEL